MKWTSVFPLLRMSLLASVFSVFLLLPASVLANPIPVEGACCLVEYACQVISEYDCQQAGGAYQGDFTTCEPNPCLPEGPCCFFNGTCQILTQAACVEVWGGWMGPGEPSCVPNPCPGCKLPCSSDACCLLDGSCRLTTSTTCEAHQGIWKGSGVLCAPDPCVPSSVPELQPEPQPPMYKLRTWGQVKSNYR